MATFSDVNSSGNFQDTTGTLIYPPTLQNHDLNPAWMQFQWYQRDNIKSSKIGQCIQLYMPEAAAQPSTVHWETEAFGFIGRTISSAARGGNITTDNVERALKDAGKLTAARAAATVGSKAAQILGGNVSAEGLMGQVAGSIPNPYMTMVFRGIDFRSFAFTFKFAPFSEGDCTTINNIVKAFRANSYSPGSGTGQGPAFLGYPNECDISYHWKDDTNPWLHKFKRSVCTAVDVDYTPAGMFSVMRNGFPAEIVVNLKFSEIELVLRDDVLNTDMTGGY